MEILSVDDIKKRFNNNLREVTWDSCTTTKNLPGVRSKIASDLLIPGSRFDNFLWKYGKKFGWLLKKIPILNLVAKNQYQRIIGKDVIRGNFNNKKDSEYDDERIDDRILKEINELKNSINFIKIELTYIKNILENKRE